MKILQFATSGLLAATITIAGLNPAHAADPVAGNITVEQALTNLLVGGLPSSYEIKTAYGYNILVHSPSAEFPASLVVEAGNQIQSLARVDNGGRYNIQNYTPTVSNFISPIVPLLQPEVEGIDIGTDLPNFSYGTTITDYKVTQIDSQNFEIVYLSDNSDDPDAVEMEGPLFMKTTIDVGLANNLVTSISVTNVEASLPDLSDGQSMPVFQFSLVTDQQAVESAWKAVVSEWANTRLDPTVQKLAARLTKTFVASSKYATKRGLTVTDATQGAQILDTYLPAAKTSVLVALNAKNQAIAVDYSSHPVDFEDMWMTIFGTNSFGKDGILFNSKKGEYNLRSLSGNVFRVGVDKSGHVTSFYSKAPNNGQYANGRQNRKVTYSPNLNSSKKWLNVPKNLRELLAIVSKANSGGEGRDAGKATFAVNGNMLDISFTYLGQPVSQPLMSLDLTQYPEGAFTKVCRILGIKKS